MTPFRYMSYFLIPALQLISCRSIALSTQKIRFRCCCMPFHSSSANTGKDLIIPLGRIRQHVNPLSKAHQLPANLDEKWLLSNFEEPITKPLLIDIGSCTGSFALDYATGHSDTNVLGLEIRRPMVAISKANQQKRGLRNAHFVQSNANIDIGTILSHINRHGVQLLALCISFPDPHFKAKHFKRRLVNDFFVDILARNTCEGTRIFVQSDIYSLQMIMLNHFTKKNLFVPRHGDDISNLTINESPFATKTDRERLCESKGLPIYRISLVRTAVPVTASTA
jgi:tRNA (guanine-N7-)-methyltransferase